MIWRYLFSVDRISIARVQHCCRPQNGGPISLPFGFDSNCFRQTNSTVIGNNNICLRSIFHVHKCTAFAWIHHSIPMQFLYWLKFLKNSVNWFGQICKSFDDWFLLLLLVGFYRTLATKWSTIDEIWDVRRDNVHWPHHDHRHMRSLTSLHLNFQLKFQSANLLSIKNDINAIGADSNAAFCGRKNERKIYNSLGFIAFGTRLIPPLARSVDLVRSISDYCDSHEIEEIACVRQSECKRTSNPKNAFRISMTFGEKKLHARTGIHSIADRK